MNGDLVAPAVAVGDTVLIDAHAGLEVKDGDQNVHIIRETDILAIVE
ncbi:Co-chaperonin GroES (HSP10) [Streptococcus suis 98HAH33]|nr:Co-chaperonin GroES (HSP10) [Streptococcus suis 98HAH33]